MRDDRRSGSTDPAAVWFDFSSDRKGVHPQTRLAAFHGILQADAYSGFDQLYASGEIHEAACWDHARRYVYDVHVRTPTPDTQQLLEMIGELYSIEADIRGNAPNERLRVRQEKTKSLLVKFETTIRAKLATLSTKSALAKAISYSLNHWAALTFYCEDGRAEISNVLAENALRCVAMGRSLCTSFRNLGKHWELPFNVVATRAMFARQRRRNSFTAQIARANLPRGIGHYLLGRQNLIVD